MLIVCPNCATSYMIDPTSVGPTGRAVRCARCKTTWFAGTAKPGSGVTAFVDGVIAEAEAESSEPYAEQSPPPNPPPDMNAATENENPAEPPADGFPPAYGSETAPAPFDDAPHNSDLAPRPDTAQEDFDGRNDPDGSQDSGQDGSRDLAVTDGPSLVPPIDLDAHADSLHGDGAYTESLRGGALRGELDPEEADSYIARRERLKARRQQSKRMSRWTAVILVLFAFNVALIGARSEVVRYLPQTASLFATIGLPVNLRNLKFDKVKITKEAQDGVNILIIEGNIVNTASKPTEVPRLRFAARNATGQDVYTWTALPRRSILGPNERLEFQSRLAAPPADATDVMVRFFTAQDAAAGVK
jgi:predicted Zn finger-like uncharacterized protein